MERWVRTLANHPGIVVVVLGVVTVAFALYLPHLKLKTDTIRIAEQEALS